MVEALGRAAANGAWLAHSWPAYRAFERALKRPAEAQACVLTRLLAENSDSAYGRTHGFKSLRSTREFQDAAPIMGYEEFSPWIGRVLNGEPRVLTEEPVLMLEKTSGSRAAAKYIPYTQSLRAEFQRAIGAWIFDLYSSRPALCLGPAYWCVTPVARARETTPGGLSVGFESDAEYLGGFEQKLLRRLLAVPAAAARAPDLDAGLYITLRFLLQEPALAFISVWNPSFLTLLLDRLNADPERLLDDLASGGLTPPVALPRELHDELAPGLKADPQRARALRSHLSRGRIPAHALWNLKVISCWAAASARLALPTLRDAFPDSEVQGKGLLATEGVVSIPLVGRRGAALALTSHFYEFAEWEGLGATRGRPKLAHELELGREYAVLLTTGGGLWRYALDDVVRVVGFADRTPLIEFRGRRDAVSDISGEKLNSVFVEGILERLRVTGVWSGSFAMLAPVLGRRPSYGLFVEGEAFWPLLAERLDALLRENPHYDYCRRLGQLEAPKAFRIASGAYADYLRRCELLGQRAGDVKPVPLNPRSGWEACFKGEFVASDGSPAARDGSLRREAR